ncbi:sulfotransferase domain-containing protein [Arthrobacter sp. H14]|uniref:sulfotransferase domain-containing protein n=1 Tax=Arthrobacter sp. H14 TaxID=1312959 RepID=UPI00047B7061|nr:sulfotransferase domain-containing protein [Arthrobacter sp. H14]
MVSIAALKDTSPRWVKNVSDAATRQYAQLTVRDRPAPDFLVIGTKRGGTTSLFNYLMMHPGIMGLYPQVRGKKSTDYFFKERQRGEHWYRSHFQTETYRKLVSRRLGYRPISGEASPYYLWDPRVAGHVRELSGGIKAIALLRDPVERAWSHYQERAQNGVEPLEFPAALEAEETRLQGELEKMLAEPAYCSTAHDFYSYRSRGVYLPQIQNWRRSFPEGQLLILRSEDMYEDVQATFDRVCDFLKVPSTVLPTTRTFNARKRSSTMPPEVEAELREYFAPHNEDLYRYLGTDELWP